MVTKYKFTHENLSNVNKQLIAIAMVNLKKCRNLPVEWGSLVFHDSLLTEDILIKSTISKKIPNEDSKLVK